MRFFQTQTKGAIVYYLTHAWFEGPEESEVSNDVSDLMNHSTNPTLKCRDDDKNECVALMDLPAGTELTYNYDTVHNCFFL